MLSVRFFKTDNILAVKVAQWKKRWFVLYNSRYTAKNLIFFSCHSVFLPCINKNQLFNSCWENYYLVVRWDLRIIHGMHFFLPPIGPLYIQFLLNTNIFSFTSMQVIHSVLSTYCLQHWNEYYATVSQIAHSIMHPP